MSDIITKKKLKKVKRKGAAYGSTVINAAVPITDSPKRDLKSDKNLRRFAIGYGALAGGVLVPSAIGATSRVVGAAAAAKDKQILREAYNAFKEPGMVEEAIEGARSGDRRKLISNLTAIGIGGTLGAYGTYRSLPKYKERKKR